MNDTLNYLQPHERMALDDYVNRLHLSLGDNLTGLWLFGSKSRGDFELGSDIDLLLVLKTQQPETRWRIREIAAQCSLEYDVLFNTTSSTRIVGTKRCTIEVLSGVKSSAMVCPFFSSVLLARRADNSKLCPNSIWEQSCKHQDLPFFKSVAVPGTGHGPTTTLLPRYPVSLDAQKAAYSRRSAVLYRSSAEGGT
ncbi:MAG: nucleotidyltransferase domain-containing protein [Anaerolineales bacterium]|nr:MAG: nucleotidyltransferase domain-containing protein [Anaerolineales bacterium]